MFEANSSKESCIIDLSDRKHISQFLILNNEQKRDMHANFPRNEKGKQEI